MNGIETILYRLPEITKATEETKTIYICEGEKDCDNLAAIGIEATTNPMGAGKWRDSYSDALRGANVVILPDNDEPGRKHARQVAESLHGKAASIKIVELPGLPDKGDVSDWLKDGTKDELETIIEAAPEWTPPEKAVDAVEPDAGWKKTDTYAAQLLAKKCGDNLRFDHARGHWLVWNGHHWRQDTGGEVLSMAKKIAEERYRKAFGDKDESNAARISANEPKLKATLALAQSEIPISDIGEGWDSDPMLLAVENGVIDLTTGELRAGKHEDKITKYIKLSYNPDARCERWERFLEEVFEGNLDLIDFIQRAIGYSLTGLTIKQCWFLLYGRGENGKSKFVETLLFLFGELGLTTSFSTFEKQRTANGNATPDLAQFEGRRFITASETNEGTRLNEARIKALTGGDTISARHLYGAPFEFMPTGKIWLAVNHKPTVRDDSHGFWRRVRLIPFERNFENDPNRDDRLIDKLKLEAPGILNWAIEGCLKWQRDGLKAPSIVMDAVKEYRLDSDPIECFLSQCCNMGAKADYSAFAKTLYDAYKKWATDQGTPEKEIISNTAFGRRMSERFSKVRMPKGVIYEGIGLKK